jgi:putative aldouronate transport system permease protein
MFLNGAVFETGDIIDTYVYRVGLLDAQFEIATATGLFKGVVGLVMIVSANTILRRFGERSIW